jgi:hypothetical protein
MNDPTINRLFTVSALLFHAFFIYSRSMTEEIDKSTTTTEIVWRFSRYRKNSAGRIAFKQNPHFYHGLPDKAARYGSKFNVNPLSDFAYAYHHQIQTIYVLVDKSCRLFLDKPPIQRVFGNLWKPDQTVILKGEYSPRYVVCFNPCAFKILSANWSQKISSFATLGRTKTRTTGIAPLIRLSAAWNRTTWVLTA